MTVPHGLLGKAYAATALIFAAVDHRPPYLIA
jgi:hypothetical protein